ncbi:hypothetical protein ACHAPA_008404 [Fusarium lateritium]
MERFPQLQQPALDLNPYMEGQSSPKLLLSISTSIAQDRRMIELLDEQIARMLIHHKQGQGRHLRNVLRNTVLTPSPARQIPTVRNIAAAGQRVCDEEEVLSNAARDEQKAVDAKTSSLLGSPWPWLAAFENTNMPDSHEEEQTLRQSSRQRSRATRIPR